MSLALLPFRCFPPSKIKASQNHPVLSSLRGEVVISAVAYKVSQSTVLTASAVAVDLVVLVPFSARLLQDTARTSLLPLSQVLSPSSHLKFRHSTSLHLIPFPALFCPWLIRLTHYRILFIIRI